jgi:hypothetical protein
MELNNTEATPSYQAGVESMSVETKEQIQEELGRSRRLLEHAPDKTTKQRLGAYI